ncbi:MAG: hypothetical protein ACKOES_01580, partial [Planctomycetaceae bacterium]
MLTSRTDANRSGSRAAGDAGPPARPVHLVAVGEAAIPALHAAALEPERFASVRLVNMVPSWADVV